jgi:hypothetical protein
MLICGLLLVAWTALPGQWSLADSADKSRDPLKGEVEDKVAFVQTFDQKLNAGICHIEAKIKFLKAGTYVVAAGLYKGKYLHESKLGKKYFETKTVKADAGDVITVKLRAPAPPSNKKVTVAVYKTSKDIQTKS